MCPGGNQRVISDQNVCVLGGFMLLVQEGALRKRYKGYVQRGYIEFVQGPNL